MKSALKVLIGFVAGIAACLLAPLAVMAFGVLDVGADATPSIIEKTLAPWAVDRSVEKHAPKEPNPYASSAPAVAAGLEIYGMTCILCHGAPGVRGAKWYEGLNPIPPFLADESDVTDGELFWIVKHGIRMTGMPAFGSTYSDEQIWSLVAFVRHLPDLTDQEQGNLQALTDKAAHK